MSTMPVIADNSLNIRHDTLSDLHAFALASFRAKDLDSGDARDWAEAAMMGWKRTGWTMSMVRKRMLGKVPL